jgi:hypothetical protein
VAATFCEVWERVCGLLAELDVLLGFADLSTAAPKPYVRPTMLPPEGAPACRPPPGFVLPSLSCWPASCLLPGLPCPPACLLTAAC